MRDQGLNVVVDPAPPAASDEDGSDDSSYGGGSDEEPTDMEDSGEDATSVNDDGCYSEGTMSKNNISFIVMSTRLIDI